MGVLCYVIFMLVQRIPGGFVPEEDQGYILVNALLPDAASLERTDAVMKKVEKILEEHEAVEGFNTISGFSLITGAYSSNMGFFFVQLKPWEERHSPGTGLVRGDQRAQSRLRPADPGRRRGRVRSRPAIPGLGTGAGFTMQLQDRSGGSPEYLAQQTQRFMEAARKRPEIGRIGSLYRASVPQIFADIDRSKVLQGRRAAERRQHHARGPARQLLRQRLQPLRTRLQGLHAGGTGVPAGSETDRAVLRQERAGRDGAARHAGVHAADPGAGVHQPLQPVPGGGAHRRVLPRASRRRRRSMPWRPPHARCCRRT